MDWNKASLAYHAEGRPGKIEVNSTKSLLSQRDLSLAYTPGVAEPCRRIHDDPSLAYDYTAKGNLVAVVTNGTAVLGLGDIGALAGKPVMEGKANLFKKFADIDVFDIEIDAATPDEVVAAVKAIAPTFGGINLEDIKAPDCFEIEQRLQDLLDIPVFHDDQHGTAIIACAGLLNALELTGRNIADIKMVFSGAGAAAIASARLSLLLGGRRENVWLCDSSGLVTTTRPGLPSHKAEFARDHPPADIAECLVGADVFLGLSVGGLLTGEMVQKMAKKPIIFAMANPDPEISYDDARAAVPDAIVATGRSDFPNQVNNVLGFPFVFRGALDCRARKITDEMKVAAVRALVALTHEEVPESVLAAYNVRRMKFGPDYIIPKPFDPRVLLWVAPAVAEAARISGVARKPIRDLDRYRQQLERLVERSRELVRPLMNRARLNPRRIVFPDGTNPRVLRAAQQLADEGICEPVLIGPEAKVRRRAEQNDVDLTGVEIVQIKDDRTFDRYATALWRSRQRKGMTLQGARSQLRIPTVYGLMMVREGDVHGLLGGLAEPYSATMRPAMQVLGPAHSDGTVSAAYVMLMKERRYFFGDCTVNENPDAETLAHIALNTARVAASLGEEPSVAMLSYSNFGSGKNDAEVAKVREALEIVRRLSPSLRIDGEMQADVAVNAKQAKEDFPFSDVAGSANVLVFPSLVSGNIAYKLLKEIGGATAIGPILTGLPHPVNVLAMGCSVSDIVNMAAITANQALDQRMAAAASGK